MRLNISRTCRAAAASSDAPAGLVPGKEACARSSGGNALTGPSQIRQNGVDRIRGNVRNGFDLSDLQRQNKSKFAASSLFVGAHNFQQALFTDTRPGPQPSNLPNQSPNSPCFLR